MQCRNKESPLSAHNSALILNKNKRKCIKNENFVSNIYETKEILDGK